MVNATVQALLGLALAACGFVLKLPQEERFLTERFGDGYRDTRRGFEPSFPPSGNAYFLYSQHATARVPDRPKFSGYCSRHSGMTLGQRGWK